MNFASSESRDSGAAAGRSFVARAHAIVTPFRAPRQRTYYLDLGLTALVAWGAVLSAVAMSSKVGFAAATLVAGLALSRAALFAHELAHLGNAVPSLRAMWNAVIGIPLLFPSFIYEPVHRAHHRRSVYRTDRDPEHAPDPRPFLLRWIATQLGALVLPAVLALRWLAAPLSFSSPRLRSWLVRRASRLTTNPAYVAPSRLSPAELRSELATSAWAYFVVIALAVGVLPVRAVVAAALAMSVAVSLSDLRGDVLHRFAATGALGTVERQVRDSLNVPAHTWFERLLLPMGIGYHALHHLAPWLPYHALPAAHARLLAILEADSLYHHASLAGLAHAARDAVAEATSRAHGRATQLERG